MNPTELATLIDRAPKGLFIDGRFVDAEGHATFEVVDPSDAGVLATVASASAADARRALDSICAA